MSKYFRYVAEPSGAVLDTHTGKRKQYNNFREASDVAERLNIAWLV